MTGGHESVQRIHLSSERNPLVFMLVQKNIRTLVLVPTPLELNSLLTHFAPPSDTLVAPCGFGVVGSSSMTQSLLQTHRPQQVILAGIAGTMSDKLLPSEVCAFDSVILDGVGVQEAEQLSSPHDLGFSHGYETSAPHRPYGEACLPLTPCPHLANAGTLLTVCAASGTMELAERRRQCYPQAVAEDMEGYAVALACSISGLPLTIIRGISNETGVRDKSKWSIRESLQSVAQALNQWAETDWSC